MTSSRTASMVAAAAVTALVALLGGAIALAALVPAQAGHQKVADATRDVKEHSSDKGDPAVEPKRRDKGTDIVSARARFADGQIVMRTTVRKLPETDYVLLWNIGTNNTLWRVYYFDEGGTTEAVLQVSDGGETGCPIATHESDDTDTVKVSVPRSCIGNKRWIRFGAAALRQVDTGIRIDDARGKRRFGDSGDARLGKKIYYN